MREWNLKAGDPLCLTIAADARFGSTDYCNDHIWELFLGGGEPPAVGLLTTYGLRARSLRLFQRFALDDQFISDPASFASSPSIQKIFPNLIVLSCAPFAGIDVTLEYWIPGSQTATGRLLIVNHREAACQLKVEIVALLVPSGAGQRIAPIVLNGIPALSGSTSGLSPVILSSGVPKVGSGPYPSLNHAIDLAPEASYSISWAEAALSETEASFNLARQTLARNWDAEHARIEMLNAGQVEILTGDPEWDIAFALSQKVAYNSFLEATSRLPHNSFVLSRLPDQGFSLRGDGQDYPQVWCGQSPLEAYYLAGLVLPAMPELAKGLLRNFLSTIAPDGFIDWKPGLGGQRSQMRATPLLATLAWRIYQFSEDRSFLEDTFAALVAYIRSWFSREQDRDGDGIPEWSHPLQAYFEDHPLFAYWQPWSLGIDISTIESPGLCAFLYRECRSLLQIAHLLGHDEIVTPFQALADNLRSAVEISWNVEEEVYRYWDRDSHYSSQAQTLGQRQGAGLIPIGQNFEQPVRVHIRLQGSNEVSRRVQIFVHGTSPNGQHLVERIAADHFHWYLGLGSATGERTYASLEQIDIQGADEADVIVVSSVGYAGYDLSLFLPLWAGIPDAERARGLVEKHITSPESFWLPFGLPVYNQPPFDQYSVSEGNHNAHIPAPTVSLPWNALILEGMLAYGYRKQAADLFMRFMPAIIKNLKRENSFRQTYHAETGQGQGERNSLEGIVPVNLFLDTLGVRLISPRQVSLSGFNPFPWPITVKYRGTTILCHTEKTTVVFPDGQTVDITDPAPCTVTLE